MAASSDSFKISHFQNFGPTSRSQRKQSKSCSGFLCKFLIIVLVLVLIPLFPSQAPEFINQTILREFWELFHLLVFGIAVSYGLFCRKSVTVEVKNQSRDDTSHAYLSGLFNVPSLFEDGFEKLTISDEKMSIQNWDTFRIGRKSSSKESPPIAEGKQLRCLTVNNGNKNANEVDKEKLSQIWNSQYIQGETLMVVTDGNCALDEHKPLGLPVRSLRSRIADIEKPESITSSGSNDCLKGSYSSITKGKFEKIRGPVPLNLEKKFQEVTGRPKSSLQPKPERMEMREEISNFGQSCHCRPHSGGNFEMERFRSRSSRHPKSFGASFLLPELSNLRKENFELKKDLEGFSDTVSQSAVAYENVGVLFAPKARGFSIGSSNELDMPRSPKDYFNDSSLSAMQHVLDREKKVSDSMISDVKPSKLAKGLARGRSVRTIRSRVFALDEMKREKINSNKTDEKVDGKHDQFEAPVLAKKVKEGDNKDQSIHKQKKNSEKMHSVPKATFALSQNNEIQNLVDGALLSEKGSESDSESEDPQGSSDEKETEPNQVEDAELEGSEVDRKADEFIAKFREQMRLQKIASVKRHNFQT